MCGIAGIVARDGVAPVALGLMARALEHRGPDGAGYLLHGPGDALRVTLRPDAAPSGAVATVGLAHRRLAIIDLSKNSDQPMVDAGGRCALVYNGEIYNYLEVRAELEALGHRFRTTGDTEVVLAAYLQWGADCVQRFIGMWAFALLDLEQQSLLLSRDRFGIKPLFYTVVRGELRFASEIKGLLATNDLELEPNDDAVRRFLLIGQVDTSEESFFRGIFQLPPAHQAVVSLAAPSVVSPRRYWAIPEREDAAPTRDAPAQLQALLHDSIRIHARSDVPVGTCLSGGLDSSAIVCVADVLRTRGEIPSFAHHGFGYVPQDETHSERPYMEAVTQMTRLEMTYVEDDPARVLDVIPLIARQQDEPFGTASIVAQWFVFEAAAREGLKVMLDGQGADEVLGGYHAYLPMVARAHLRAWRLLRYARFSAEHERRWGTKPLAPLDALASAVPPLRRLGDARTRRLTAAAATLKPGFRGAWHRADEGSLAPRSINEILGRATTTQLPALLRFEDRNSMAHSLEARVPFLDHRLVEFAFRLPGEQKIHDAAMKHVLREGLVGILPEAVRARTDKVGFRADPGITWKFAARHRDALLRSGTAFDDRWFDRAALQRLLDTSDRTSENEFALWRAISVKLWLAGSWPGERETLAT